MKYVRSLSAINHNDVDAAGERAVDLALLNTRGYKVPTSFVVTNEAFEEFIKQNELQQRIGEALAKYADKSLSYGLVRELMLNARMPSEIASAIMDGYEALGIKQDGPVKDLLDTEKAPFVSVILSPNHTLPAEMLEGMVLGVKGLEKLLIAIKEAWACLFTPAMQEFRKSAGITNKNLNTGVIVQHLCKGALTGEGYSATQEHLDQVTVKAYFGFPSNVAKDEWRLTELLKPVYHNLAVQTEMLSWDDEERIGKVPIGERGEKEKLNERDVIELGRLAKKASLELERAVKIAVDIDKEWQLLLCNRLLLTQGSIKLREAETEERIEDEAPLIPETPPERPKTPEIEPESEGGLLDDIRPEPLAKPDEAPKEDDFEKQEEAVAEFIEEQQERKREVPEKRTVTEEASIEIVSDIVELTEPVENDLESTAPEAKSVPDPASEDDSIFSSLQPEDLNSPGPSDAEQRRR